MEQTAKNRSYMKLLNVQPTSYSVTKEPLLVLITAEEYYNNYNSAVHAAEIRIHYQVLAPRRLRSAIKHSFVASFRQSHTGGDVVLTAPLSGGRAVFLDPSNIRGSRIGTYLMNEIVGWAKQWPGADVSPIHLLTNQAHDNEEFHKGRRNRFYEQFQIEFDYSDPNAKEAGVSKPMKAAALTQVDTWKENIVEIGVFNYLAQLLEQADSVATTLEDTIRARDNWAKRYKLAEANPGRWFVQALFNKYAWLLGLIVMLAVAGTVGYRLLIEVRQL